MLNCFSTYFYIHWLILVCAPIWYQTHSIRMMLQPTELPGQGQVIKHLAFHVIFLPVFKHRVATRHTSTSHLYLSSSSNICKCSLREYCNFFASNFVFNIIITRAMMYIFQDFLSYVSLVLSDIFSLIYI